MAGSVSLSPVLVEPSYPMPGLGWRVLVVALEF